MTNVNRMMLVVAISTGIAACAPKEPVQTVDWYKTHEAERTAMVARCDANPGELEDTPNCINAIDAKNALMWSNHSAIKIKPLTFGQKPDPEQPKKGN